MDVGFGVDVGDGVWFLVLVLMLVMVVGFWCSCLDFGVDVDVGDGVWMLELVFCVGVRVFGVVVGVWC